MVWIDIIIKAPNQRLDDQTIKCELEWTVLRLKSHLSSAYPTKPVSIRLFIQCVISIEITCDYLMQTFLYMNEMLFYDI